MKLSTQRIEICRKCPLTSSFREASVAWDVHQRCLFENTEGCMRVSLKSNNLVVALSKPEQAVLRKAMSLAEVLAKLSPVEKHFSESALAAASGLAGLLGNVQEEAPTPSAPPTGAETTTETITETAAPAEQPEMPY